MKELLNRFLTIAREEGLDTAVKRTREFSLERSDKIPRSIVSWFYEYRYGPGLDVMNQDWDNLFLLDACRYDYFKPQVDIKGELKSVISRGAHSWEFMNGNFVGRDLRDTVYVTANPHVDRLSDDIFYTIESLLDQWDEDLGATLPEDVFEAAINAHERYPNKRLIIHFMQPHHPFLGTTAEEIREDYNVRGYNNTLAHDEMKDMRSGDSIYKLVRQDLLPPETMFKAYSETLDIVLETIERLIPQLNGKSIISSDHGEMLGERGVFLKRYGHPHDIYNHELRKVPWFIIDSDHRREIVEEDPIGFDRLSDDIVNQRLQALGYAPK